MILTKNTFEPQLTSLDTARRAPLFRRTGKLVAVFAWLIIALIQPVAAQVYIQIVNDSGLPDSNVWVKVPGYAIGSNPTTTPSDLFVDLGNTNPPEPTSVQLSTLPTDGTTISSISGNTDTVYTCQVDYVNSGGMYFTYNTPFTFTNGLTPSPPPNSAGNAYRYDYAEFTINDTNAANNAIDVTYVDKFGIPLQLEWFNGASSNLVAGSYVYLSTMSLVKAFENAGLGQAIFSLGSSDISAGWTYSGPDSYTNFARILAPQKVSGTTSSVFPYPSITNYLNSLAGNPFWMNGAAPQGGYYYVGYEASIDPNSSGWEVTLAPTTNYPPYMASILGAAGALPYTSTITFEISNTNASQYVYGAPVGPGYYSVNGISITNTTSPTYKVETWMIGDVLSSLNFGFWGGVYGTNSADWFSTMKWTAFPFGSARPTNDGYYNPYAALIYDYADPYSFAFSERITPDVLMTPTNGDTVRITILPDNRLDSPVVSTGLITTNSITLNWNAVTGAGGYQVNVLRPLGVPSILTSGTSYTLTNLQAGTPYEVSVQATNVVNGNPIATPARPVYATTTGTYLSVTNATGNNLIPVKITFGASDTYYQIGAVYVNGFQMLRTNSVNTTPWLNTNGQPIGWIASPGTNQVVLTVVDSNNRVIFNNWLQFDLAQPFTFTNDGTNADGLVSFDTTNSAISDIVMGGQKLSQPAPAVTGPPNVIVGAIPGFGASVVGVTNYLGSATNFIISLPASAVTVGLSYVPAETRKFAPVGSSLPSAPTWGSLVRLPNGDFQLEYTNDSTLNFNVYASTNFVDWKMIGTGINLSPGLYQFTDSNASGYKYRFYQLRSQ
ncbi:MAG TPA: beta-1,3-glucanase family protein [Pseudomonadales bacterium]|nr:beta-1,3-glucanase family protein [Pseudomonadales bacterium]